MTLNRANLVPHAATLEPAGALVLAVVLPTLNERANVTPMIARLEEALGPSGWEVLFVDDDSPDGTAEEARRIASIDSRVRVIQRIGRRGLAGAAIEGACATAAPYVAVMDADLQHDPGLLSRMLDAVASGECDVATASRFVTGGTAAGLSSARREQGSRIANALARRLTGTDLTDVMSGFFLLRTELFRRQVARLSGIGFKILLDILVNADTPLRVREFPLHFSPRRSGQSKLDCAVAFDFLVGLYELYIGRIIPTRFALFGTVGALGVLVHMAVLVTLFRGLEARYVLAQAGATLAAMTFNFWLNNFFTYRDQQLRGARALLLGWAGFCATCLVGGAANVGVAAMLHARGANWVFASLVGIVLGSMWNYALSNRFVWGRFR